MASALANSNYEPELPHSGAGSAPPTGSQPLPAARVARPSTETPAWSPDLAQVQDFLQLLARAVRQLHTYPPASPLCVDAITACRQSLVALQTRDRIDTDTIPLTQEFLAQMLGVRRTTVTIIAHALQERGLLRYRRGHIEIAPGEVVVSSTAKDLVAGSGLRFVDRGTHDLRGVPGEWRLFAVEA